MGTSTGNANKICDPMFQTKAVTKLVSPEKIFLFLIMVLYKHKDTGVFRDMNINIYIKK